MYVDAETAESKRDRPARQLKQRYSVFRRSHDQDEAEVYDHLY